MATVNRAGTKTNQGQLDLGVNRGLDREGMRINIPPTPASMSLNRMGNFSRNPTPNPEQAKRMTRVGRSSVTAKPLAPAPSLGAAPMKKARTRGASNTGTVGKGIIGRD